MIPLAIDYATPSAFSSDRERAQLGLTANRRRPVRFHARVKDRVLPLRMALQTLGEVIWSSDLWLSSAGYASFFLDPVITVHPDRVFFEAFSQDQSVYALLVAERELFETEGEVRCGTTNVDFTAWLWAALGEMRSSRQTWLCVEPQGFEVATAGAGGRFEQKVELPDSWVRGFLQVQAAMSLPGTRVAARPVDLLAALRFLRFTKAKVSPRALRYEFEPGRPVRIVLEPWEEVIPLKDADHNYEELRVIRTWGRRRLRLLEPLLPYADGVVIYLKGRALPSFYAVQFPGLTLLLGLSGWSEQGWTGAGSFDLLMRTGAVETDMIARAVEWSRERNVARLDDLATGLGLPRDEAAQLMTRLCRQGRAIYDLERREFRFRDLFEEPVDEAKLFPPDSRQEEARWLLAKGQVAATQCEPRETRKIKKLPQPDGGHIKKEVSYWEWHVAGKAGDQAVEIVVRDAGQIIFGTCGCPFFKENLLNRGPCTHMMALLAASEGQCRDLPTSHDAPGDAPLGIGGAIR
jgi:hypothetical protein